MKNTLEAQGASAEERAQRRFDELNGRGLNVTLSGLLADIQARDDRDMNRKVAPLVPAEDAIVIDTTTLNAEQVFNEVQNILEQAVINGKLKQSLIA